MCVRAPAALPGLRTHYTRTRSPAACCGDGGGGGVSSASPSPSPSSSEECPSPGVVCSYRRLGERGGRGEPLMRRLALGLGGGGGGALMMHEDDDSTPLVADTPTTPSTVPLCMNGGYVHDGADAAAATRHSNREPPSPRSPAPPVPELPAAARNVHHAAPAREEHSREFNKCMDIQNCSCALGVGVCVSCSRTASSASSGASSSSGGGAASRGSGNNNPRPEPELRHAPWFQQGIPREIALEVLSAQPVGAFLVRGSTTQPHCHALSLRVPRDFQPAGIAHYLILSTNKGYKIKGFTKEFSSLSSLVTHHSVMPELLPVPLRLTRPGPGPGAGAGAGAALPPGGAWAGAGAGRARREHADLEALSPRRAPHSPPPRRAHSQHSTPHRGNKFMAQMDLV